MGVKRSRIKTRRFFLSGINEKVSSKQILNYLQDRQIIPTLLRVFTSKQKGTLSAKLNVRDEDSAKVLDKDFWPKYVRCRNWVSQKQFDKTRNQTTCTKVMAQTHQFNVDNNQPGYVSRNASSRNVNNLITVP